MRNEKDARMLLPDEKEYPDELTARYELLERFSCRQETETLLARRRGSRELVTVKCFSAGHPLYGQEEPEQLKNLDAPPLPRFLGEYRNERMRCTVRQYISGETLDKAAAGARFSGNRTAEVGISLCGQLAALHGTRPAIIHRDIKPENIILREDGEPVLIDFGIARVQSARETDTEILGTRGFAPPEQYGFSRTDARSDIYSLGKVLEWMLYGEAEMPKDAGSPLDRVIRKMTAFDPSKRYETAEQVREALRRATPAGRKRRSLLKAAGILAAGAAALGVLLAIPQPGPRTPEFRSPLIREAARRSLGLGENEPMTEEMLSQVRGIYIIADQVCAGSDEFYATVNAWYAGGKNSRGNITDPEDLRSMPELEEVCIAAQEIEDISVLADLKMLKKAELKHNYIRDISPLTGLARLTSVGLNDNPVTDLSPLKECPNLVILDLCDARNYDPKVFTELGSFDYLNLSNPTDSYRYLGGKSVRELQLGWTGITDLRVLDGISRLEELDISHTAVRDLGPLVNHQGLRRLNIAATQVRDLSPLKELPGLERVVLSRDMEGRTEMPEDPYFEILIE